MAPGDTCTITPVRGYIKYLNETNTADKDITDVFDSDTINTIKGIDAENIRRLYLSHVPIKQEDVEHFDANRFITQVGSSPVSSKYLNDLLQFTIDNYSRQNNEYMKKILYAQKKIQYLKSA